MRNFVITTDNTTDLPYDYYKKNQIEYLFLSYTMDGKNYKKNAEMDPKEFYQKMRQGSMPTTSQANVEETMETWKPILDEGNDILHLAFSSGLSGRRAIRTEKSRWWILCALLWGKDFSWTMLWR